MITNREEAIQAILRQTTAGVCREGNCDRCALARKDAEAIVDAVIDFTRGEHDRPGGEE